ncbi:MAG: hypothetical protein ACJ0Q1_11045 [Luminiphilus sp.]
MTLHMLFGSAQLESCLALLGKGDTLMVMDSDALESLSAATVAPPCDVVVLEDTRSRPDDNEDFALIDTASWLELVCQHPHSMSWY